MNLKVKNALISVSNKENLISILKTLKKFNIKIISSGGTYSSIIKLGYECTELSKMGGDIFIHGKSATIGCIPIGDEAIEEVFLLTKKAINNNIKVIPPGYTKNLKNMGLYCSGNKGSLNIIFDVEFPEILTEETKDTLKTILN